MARKIDWPTRILPVALALALNTVVHVLPLLVLALLRALTPGVRARNLLGRGLVLLAESWIAVNSRLLDWLTPTRIVVEGLDTAGLRRDANWLMLCNHRSWVDIPVLQYVFNRRAPFMRFFLKRQLIWVPLLGLAWWALDFPFMRRHSRAEIEREPALADVDREITRRACRKFRGVPVTVMNFVEGTRFSEAKRAAQDIPWRHLLRPKAGGVTQVLDAMGDLLAGVIDVTIDYPDDRVSFADLLAGRVREVWVRVRVLPLPESGGDVRDWLNRLWDAKDREIAAIRAAATA